MLQPINIKVTDDVENYITAEMDAKIYSCLVSDGIIKGLGNDCQVIIGENDIKIQNGLLNIQGYFATINDFHSIPKPQQDKYYVKVKFTKGANQDEFVIYTQEGDAIYNQDLFNGGKIREVIIAEVKNKNQVTMKNVNDTFNNLRASLQNIFNTEQERRTAEEERKRAEQDRKRTVENIPTLINNLNDSLTRFGKDTNNKIDEINKNISSMDKILDDGTKQNRYCVLKKIKNKFYLLNGTKQEIEEFMKAQ